MGIFDTELDYSDLIQYAEGTLQLGSFVQIRNALIKRMKDIYGNDIDVSPASADGQYVNSIALIIHNIFQAIQKGNESLDPAVASGRYLDTLCSFNNIFRIMPSQSSANLYVYNANSQPMMVSRLTFIDKNNTLWIWDNGGAAIEIPSKKPYPLIGVLCEELGPISAPGTGYFCKIGSDGALIKSEEADPSFQDWDDSSLYSNSEANGTIWQCIDNIGLRVWQYENASVGNSEESDEELRSRRYQTLGSNSATVLESLKSKLLSISFIKDAYIFNNMLPAEVTLSKPGYEPVADGCELRKNSVYIAVQLAKGIDLTQELNEAISKIIYQKMTPGIATSPFESSTAICYEAVESKPSDWQSHSERYRKMTEVSNGTEYSPSQYYSFDSQKKAYSLLTSDSAPSDWGSGEYYEIGEADGAWDQNANYSFPEGAEMHEIARTLTFSDFIYWKRCLPISPDITLNFQTNEKLYDYPASSAERSSVESAIVASILSRISKTKINEYLSVADLLTAMQQGDILKSGMPTFYAQNGSIGGDTQSIFPANLSYFDYSEDDFHFDYKKDSSDNSRQYDVLTISKARSE